MTFLAFVIVLILLCGEALVLRAFGLFVGGIVLFGLFVWTATATGLEPATIALVILLAIPCLTLVLSWLMYVQENRERPPHRRRTFSEFYKDIGNME